MASVEDSPRIRSACFGAQCRRLQRGVDCTANTGAWEWEEGGASEKEHPRAFCCCGKEGDRQNSIVEREPLFSTSCIERTWRGLQQQISRRFAWSPGFQEQAHARGTLQLSLFPLSQDQKSLNRESHQERSDLELGVVLVRESSVTLESQHLCHHPGCGSCGPSVEASQSFLCVRVREEVGSEKRIQPTQEVCKRQLDA